MNLAGYLLYLSASLYFIFTDPIYNGFAPMIFAIIIMFIHIGSMLLALLFINIFQGKKINGV